MSELVTDKHSQRSDSGPINIHKKKNFFNLFRNLLYRYDVISFSLVESICSAFVKPLQVDVQSVNIVSTEIRKQFIGKK